MHTMPLLYHPTISLWIDDDSHFLAMIKEAFSLERQVETSLSPLGSIDRLLKEKGILASLPIFKKDIFHEELGSNYQALFNIDLMPLSDLFTNSNRLKETSVIIVDYHMPEISGIELCQALEFHPSKKILLTGAAEDKQAIDAFNKKLIHAFVRKDSPTILDDLRFHLSSLTEEYFREATRSLLAHLELDRPLALSDPKFVMFFKSWCKKNAIREYYLVDKNGGFLVINQENQLMYFIIHTERSLDSFVEDHQDDAEIENFTSAIVRREKIPFFGFDKQSWEHDVKDWSRHFYDPQVIEGREKYYYCVVP